MFIDARGIPQDQEIETDLCIVGAGAAGITLARELSGSALRVVLLESGGHALEKATQTLNAGLNVGLPYYPLESSRLRFLGGTTNHWAGESRPLDPLDFEARDWMPNSGWPFERETLDPYYERAQSVCGLGPFDYRRDRWTTASTPPATFPEDQVVTTIFQRNHPLRFGPTYASELEQQRNLRTYLYANAIDLEANEAGRRVDRIGVACLSGNRFRVRARSFVLALGTIETTRLLLQSGIARAGGFGRSQPWIGRYFMEHPYVEIGELFPASPQIGAQLIRRATQTINGTGIVRALTFPESRLRAEKLPNFQVFFEAMETPASAALRNLDGWRRGPLPAHFERNLVQLIGTFDDAPPQPVAAVGERMAGVSRIRVNITFEPRPDPASRVRLGSRRDALGQPQVQLEWRVDPTQKRDLRRIAASMGAAFARAGIGRMKLTLDADDSGWRQPPRGSWHQLGCTRMSTDPTRGVVDPDCRVHGFANLHLASGSVFPTVGYANPTLSIVALAIRLADHLERGST